jgi:carbamoyltransferase
LWNPDAVLSVESIKHADITRTRVDKAAALQLVFEDAVAHVVEYLIRTTNGASQLVWTGGSALNCLTSMHLLEWFDEAYYQRYFEHVARNTKLHLWIPPIPGDAGVAAGAAIRFATDALARIGKPLRLAPMQHAFLCGSGHTDSELQQQLDSNPDMQSLFVGTIAGIAHSGSAGSAATRHHNVAVVADLLAYIVAHNGIIGVFHGAAESGPRALGHRTILANACHADTREILNRHVKYREMIRPLAPMATAAAAQQYFHLDDGANNDDDFNAYNYMVLTVRAKPLTRQVAPSIVHADGTSRIQIVRPEIDPLIYHYLVAMGKRAGAELSVNTSLNVGTPIVQTVEQALDCIRRAHAMHAVCFISDSGRVVLVWHRISQGIKDGGQQLTKWLDDWLAESNLSLPLNE